MGAGQLTVRGVQASSHSHRNRPGIQLHSLQNAKTDRIMNMTGHSDSHTQTLTLIKAFSINLGDSPVSLPLHSLHVDVKLSHEACHLQKVV